MKWWERLLLDGIIQNFSGLGVDMPDTDLNKTRTLIKKSMKPDCQDCFDSITFFCESMCHHNQRIMADKIEEGFDNLSRQLEELKNIVGDGFNGKSN